MNDLPGWQRVYTGGGDLRSERPSTFDGCMLFIAIVGSIAAVAVPAWLHYVLHLF